MEAEHLAGENGAKGPLRRLGLQLPPLPEETSVLEHQLEGHNSPEGASSSRWGLRVTQGQATRTPQV